MKKKLMPRCFLVMLSMTFVASNVLAVPPRLPKVSPEDAGMDSKQLEHIDGIVAEGIAAGQMPGCVIAVGHRGKIAWLKAYGHKQEKPVKVPMTVDTVFDMASITKPVATGPSIMKLVEQGQLRIAERVSAYVPPFGAEGKQGITLFQLLTHQGGLIPDNSLKDYQDGPRRSMERIYGLKLFAEPGTKFIYTDVGFIMLADLVHKISGKNIHEFSQEHVFRPLGMIDTGYRPDADRRKRAAPTEMRNGKWMQGEVHDPRAYLLDGIAGHAGLFSTAHDLAIYAQMMLGGGEYAGVRVLSKRTVEVMTAAQTVSSGLRGLGWDKQTGYSSNRGELFTTKAFGHGGFTGTSLWIDPGLDLFVIFLGNRLHPDGKGSINRLAGRIGSVAAASIKRPGQASPASMGLRPVMTGVDVLAADQFRLLKGQKVGLITNHTGINRVGQSTVRVLHRSPDVQLVSLFSPEHGFRGVLDQSNVGDVRDEETGLVVHSLYGKTRQPTAESLAAIDTLVFDIQDIGTRFYTYASTMGLAMEAAAKAGKRFVVLDRPNPINGHEVAGPVLDPGRESFVGFHPVPVRHGMTMGELARMFRDEKKMKLDLQVVKMEGWHRGDFFDRTDLPWVNPSPNMRNLSEALLYPGIGLLETTNLSVGRGTDTPFEILGAPWLDGQELARHLNQQPLPGVRFVPVRFTPGSSKFSEESCGGVSIVITDRGRFRPLTLGLEIACWLRQHYPKTWKVAAYDRLLADKQTLEAVQAGKKTVWQIQAAYQAELTEFRKRRARYLLYRE